MISTVERLDPSILGLVRDRLSGLSKGGMASKLEAARLATTGGENVIIASGRQPDVLPKIIAGEPVGTLFLAQGQTRRRPETLDRLHGPAPRPPGARRRRPPGRSSTKGRSLLAIGVVDGRGPVRTRATSWRCATPTAWSSPAA